ncbi:DM13 domain-containing protein [Longispora sp. NPDC051575]|uniref:DM13 domain-containing protein n=1 Tax=Longispora sp. NPDC051575 TaxID=3154943 RepID=UPI00341EC1C7
MRKGILLAGVVLVVAVAFGLYWFQPWKAIVDRQVDEAIPTVATTTGPSPSPGVAVKVDTVLLRGTFISHEHQTTGAVEVIDLADGRRVLALRDLDTSNGPDLYVWLTDAPSSVTDLGSTRYLDLGKLKGNKGSQVYEIPAGTDLAPYKSVSIWCKRFSASFGAADLIQT